jgi:hypothetical protein
MSVPVGDPFSEGVDAGVARVARYDLIPEGAAWLGWDSQNNDPEVVRILQEPVRNAAILLERSGSSQRFRELFGEMVSVATVARAYYEDQPPNDALIDQYLRESVSFFNSFTHA